MQTLTHLYRFFFWWMLWKWLWCRKKEVIRSSEICLRVCTCRKTEEEVSSIWLPGFWPTLRQLRVSSESSLPSPLRFPAGGREIKRLVNCEQRQSRYILKLIQKTNTEIALQAAVIFCAFFCILTAVFGVSVGIRWSHWSESHFRSVCDKSCHRIISPTGTQRAKWEQMFIVLRDRVQSWSLIKQLWVRGVLSEMMTEYLPPACPLSWEGPPVFSTSSGAAEERKTNKSKAFIVCVQTSLLKNCFYCFITEREEYLSLNKSGLDQNLCALMLFSSRFN